MTAIYLSVVQKRIFGILQTAPPDGLTWVQIAARAWPDHNPYHYKESVAWALRAIKRELPAIVEADPGTGRWHAKPEIVSVTVWIGEGLHRRPRAAESVSHIEAVELGDAMIAAAANVEAMRAERNDRVGRPAMAYYCPKCDTNLTVADVRSFRTSALDHLRNGERCGPVQAMEYPR